GAVLKTVERASVPWVRIPPPPPFKKPKPQRFRAFLIGSCVSPVTVYRVCILLSNLVGRLSTVGWAYVPNNTKSQTVGSRLIISNSKRSYYSFSTHYKIFIFLKNHLVFTQQAIFAPDYKMSNLNILNLLGRYAQPTYPNFNGYVDKSVIKLINDWKKFEIRRELCDEFTNQVKTYPVNETAIEEVIVGAKNALKNLKSLMSHFHESTFLILDKNKNFVLRNEKLKGHEIDMSDYQLFTKSVYGRAIYVFDSISRAVRKLKPEDAKKIDKKLFIRYAEEATRSNFPSPMLRAKEANELASEFGDDTNWVERTRKILDKRRQMQGAVDMAAKVREEKENKQIQRKNIQILKSLLKKYNN
ncbi:MAG: hypothetical protein NC191_10455, partial [Muribaculaceae bacterium]|nr:hypothetical protein [Muribaculaceae bacterium]